MPRAASDVTYNLEERARRCRYYCLATWQTDGARLRGSAHPRHEPSWLFFVGLWVSLAPLEASRSVIEIFADTRTSNFALPHDS